MEDDDILSPMELELLTPAEREEGLRELQEVQELGLGPDGSRMQLGDEDWYGGNWEPDANEP